MLGSCSDRQTTTPTPPSVYIAQVGEGNTDDSRSFAGHIVDQHSISLGFKTAGQIKRICVREGQHVAAGQLLAELDNSDYCLGVEALQIQYDQVAAEVARTKRLFEKKSITANDFEKAEAGLRQLGVQLQVNKNKLAYTQLHAPTSGIIGAVNFEAAEMVDAGTAVFTLLNSSPLEVECEVPASVYSNLAHFNNFTGTVSGQEGIYPLKVLSVVPKADSNQLYRLRLGFASAIGKQITAGLNVAVQANCQLAASEFTVPAAAVFNHEGKENVWVLQADSTVTMRPVSISGVPSEGQLTIAAGLSNGEQVVSAGVAALHQGQRVRVIEQPSKTNVGGLL